MTTVYLTRIVEFDASHRIARADWTADENARTFGKAAQDHAHRYQVRVTVKGRLAAGDGGVVNLQALDALLEQEITTRFAGRHVNTDIPEFAAGGRLATGEALAVYVWERVAAALPPGVTLHAVRVQEGPHLYSEYFGDA
jgi:6-pyruvoyltetrahydropterin/6-carboxytetrahydropterin synthase